MMIYRKTGSRYRELTPLEILNAGVSVLHERGLHEEANKINLIIFNSLEHIPQPQGDKVEELNAGTLLDKLRVILRVPEGESIVDHATMVMSDQ